MQAFLGLLFFSVFLATGAGLQCETCVAISDSCSGNKQTCPSSSNVCLTMVTEVRSGEMSIKTAVKGCSQQSECQQLKGEVGKSISTQFMNIQAGSVIKHVECSKASTSSASLLLALSGLLLMKLLF